ncbi:MAG: class I SAM-dependent methyltransferase [Acidobacteria bacterium]|nr:MAG: class I SAM-dependent methyltransferase [Acidobacteriota bacterium]
MSDRKVFDRYASTYADTVNAAIGASGENADFFARLKALHVRRALGASAPRKILDFGCGVGTATHALAEVFPSTLIIGCDDSLESINAARRSAGTASDRLRFVIHGPGGLPLRDSSVDVAFASCVFHHIETSAQATWLGELRRVLRVGAPLFLFEHNPYNPLTLRVVRACPFDAGVKLLRPPCATRIIRSAGFRVGRPRYYFFFPHVLQRLRPAEAYMDWLPLGGQYYIVGWRES